MDTHIHTHTGFYEGLEAILEDEIGSGPVGENIYLGQIVVAPAALLLVGACVLIGNKIVHPMGMVFLAVILLAYLAAFVGLFATLVCVRVCVRVYASLCVFACLCVGVRVWSW